MLFSVFCLNRNNNLYLQRYPLFIAKFDITKELQEENEEANSRANAGVKTSINGVIKSKSVVKTVQQKPKQMKSGVMYRKKMEGQTHETVMF